jgi:hypothetical protein
MCNPWPKKPEPPVKESLTADAKREPATVEQVAEAYKASYENGCFSLIFYDAWRAAEQPSEDVQALRRDAESWRRLMSGVGSLDANMEDKT